MTQESLRWVSRRSSEFQGILMSLKSSRGFQGRSRYFLIVLILVNLNLMLVVQTAPGIRIPAAFQSVSVGFRGRCSRGVLEDFKGIPEMFQTVSESIKTIKRIFQNF